MSRQEMHEQYIFVWIFSLLSRQNGTAEKSELVGILYSIIDDVQEEMCLVESNVVRSLAHLAASNPEAAERLCIHHSQFLC